MSLIPLLVGFVVGAALFSVLLILVVRSTRKSVSQELDEKDAALVELRQEAAADRETNRRLRHEMHGLRTAKGVVGLAPQGDGGDNSEFASADPVNTHHLQIELEEANAQIADQDAKLKQYRQALTEIRMSLEARDPLTKLVQITDEVPSAPDAGAASDVA